HVVDVAHRGDRIVVDDQVQQCGVIQVEPVGQLYVAIVFAQRYAGQAFDVALQRLVIGGRDGGVAHQVRCVLALDDVFVQEGGKCGMIDCRRAVRIVRLPVLGQVGRLCRHGRGGGEKKQYRYQSSHGVELPV